jgi:hypothetical protein
MCFKNEITCFIKIGAYGHVPMVFEDNNAFACWNVAIAISISPTDPQKVVVGLKEASFEISVKIHCYKPEVYMMNSI